MRHRIISVVVKKYPVATFTFLDGFKGDVDFSQDINQLEVCAPLKDPEYFAKIAVRGAGDSVGWRLDDLGNEIDYAADTMRADAEVAAVKRMADEYRQSRQAS
jgi:hypothetical protein